MDNQPVVNRHRRRAAVTPLNPETEAMADLLDAAADRSGISPAALMRLLEAPAPRSLETLFAAARRQRERHFGRTVFLYGFLYISTYCRNRCSFCRYRSTNSQATRYRKSLDQIQASARQLARSGVHLIDVTAGEDPCLHHGDSGILPVVHTVQAIRQETGLPLMVSVGVVADRDLARLAAAGADWYACYQETHNRRLFARLRRGQSYDQRFGSKMAAKASGMLVEEGVLCGVGETAADLIDSFGAMARLQADQVRAMSFVPQPGTPLKDRPPAAPVRELVAIALMRLLFPGRLIPASLDIDGLDGLKQRLDAGANVVTSLVPPGLGLAGVARQALDIEEGRRSVAGITPILEACRLRPGTGDQYRRWVRQRKRAAGTVEQAC